MADSGEEFTRKFGYLKRTVAAKDTIPGLNITVQLPLLGTPLISRLSGIPCPSAQAELSAPVSDLRSVLDRNRWRYLRKDGNTSVLEADRLKCQEVFDRIIIVGDSRLEQLNHCWPLNSRFKPEFYYKPDLLLSELPNFVLKNVISHNGNECILLICSTGIRDIVESHRHPGCHKGSFLFEGALKKICVAEQVSTFIGEMLVVKRDLQLLLAASSSIVFTSVLPMDLTAFQWHQHMAYTGRYKCQLAPLFQKFELIADTMKLIQILKVLNQRIAAVVNVGSSWELYQYQTALELQRQTMKPILMPFLKDGLDLTNMATCTVAYKLVNLLNQYCTARNISENLVSPKLILANQVPIKEKAKTVTVNTGIGLSVDMGVSLLCSDPVLPEDLNRTNLKESKVNASNLPVESTKCTTLKLDDESIVPSLSASVRSRKIVLKKIPNMLKDSSATPSFEIPGIKDVAVSELKNDKNIEMVSSDDVLGQVHHSQATNPNALFEEKLTLRSLNELSAAMKYIEKPSIRISTNLNVEMITPQQEQMTDFNSGNNPGHLVPISVESDEIFKDKIHDLESCEANLLLLSTSLNAKEVCKKPSSVAKILDRCNDETDIALPLPAVCIAREMKEQNMEILLSTEKATAEDIQAVQSIGTCCELLPTESINHYIIEKVNFLSEEVKEVEEPIANIHLELHTSAAKVKLLGSLTKKIELCTSANNKQESDIKIKSPESAKQINLQISDSHKSTEAAFKTVENKNITKIIIVGDSRISDVNSSWSTTIGQMPFKGITQLHCKKDLSLEELPKYLYQLLTYDRKDEGRFLLVCSLGIHSIIKMHYSAECDQKHQTFSTASIVDHAVSITHRFMQAILNTKRILQAMFPECIEIMFTNILPVDFTVFQNHQYQKHLRYVKNYLCKDAGKLFNSFTTRIWTDNLAVALKVINLKICTEVNCGKNWTIYDYQCQLDKCVVPLPPMSMPFLIDGLDVTKMTGQDISTNLVNLLQAYITSSCSTEYSNKEPVSQMKLKPMPDSIKRKQLEPSLTLIGSSHTSVTEVSENNLECVLVVEKPVTSITENIVSPKMTELTIGTQEKLLDLPAKLSDIDALPDLSTASLTSLNVSNATNDIVSSIVNSSVLTTNAIADEADHSRSSLLTNNTITSMQTIVVSGMGETTFSIPSKCISVSIESSDIVGNIAMPEATIAMPEATKATTLTNLPLKADVSVHAPDVHSSDELGTVVSSSYVPENCISSVAELILPADEQTGTISTEGILIKPSTIRSLINIKFPTNLKDDRFPTAFKRSSSFISAPESKQIETNCQIKTLQSDEVSQLQKHEILVSYSKEICSIEPNAAELISEIGNKCDSLIDCSVAEISQNSKDLFVDLDSFNIQEETSAILLQSSLLSSDPTKSRPQSKTEDNLSSIPRIHDMNPLTIDVTNNCDVNHVGIILIQKSELQSLCSQEEEDMEKNSINLLGDTSVSETHIISTTADQLSASSLQPPDITFIKMVNPNDSPAKSVSNVPKSVFFPQPVKGNVISNDQIIGLEIRESTCDEIFNKPLVSQPIPSLVSSYKMDGLLSVEQLFNLTSEGCSVENENAMDGKFTDTDDTFILQSHYLATPTRDEADDEDKIDQLLMDSICDSLSLHGSCIDENHLVCEKTLKRKNMLTTPTKDELDDDGRRTPSLSSLSMSSLTASVVDMPHHIPGSIMPILPARVIEGEEHQHLNMSSNYAVLAECSKPLKSSSRRLTYYAEEESAKRKLCSNKTLSPNKWRPLSKSPNWKCESKSTNSRSRSPKWKSRFLSSKRKSRSPNRKNRSESPKWNSKSRSPNRKSRSRSPKVKNSFVSLKRKSRSRSPKIKNRFISPKRNSRSPNRKNRSESPKWNSRSRSPNRKSRSRSPKIKNSFVSLKMKSRSRSPKIKNSFVSLKRKSRSRSPNRKNKSESRKGNSKSRSTNGKSRSRSPKRKNRFISPILRKSRSRSPSMKEKSESPNWKSMPARHIQRDHFLRKKLDNNEREAIIQLALVHDREYQLFQNSPDCHPDYQKEYRAFIERKLLSILELGGDPQEYSPCNDWLTFWPMRMKELNEVMWQQKKKQCQEIFKKKRELISSTPDMSTKKTEHQGKRSKETTKVTENLSNKEKSTKRRDKCTESLKDSCTDEVDLKNSSREVLCKTKMKSKKIQKSKRMEIPKEPHRDLCKSREKSTKTFKKSLPKSQEHCKVYKKDSSKGGERLAHSADYQKRKNTGKSEKKSASDKNEELITIVDHIQTTKGVDLNVHRENDLTFDECNRIEAIPKKLMNKIQINLSVPPEKQITVDSASASNIVKCNSRFSEKEDIESDMFHSLDLIEQQINDFNKMQAEDNINCLSSDKNFIEMATCVDEVSSTTAVTSSVNVIDLLMILSQLGEFLSPFIASINSLYSAAMNFKLSGNNSKLVLQEQDCVLVLELILSKLEEVKLKESISLIKRAIVAETCLRIRSILDEHKEETSLLGLNIPRIACVTVDKEADETITFIQSALQYDGHLLADVSKDQIMDIYAAVKSYQLQMQRTSKEHQKNIQGQETYNIKVNTENLFSSSCGNSLTSGLVDSSLIISSDPDQMQLKPTATFGKAQKSTLSPDFNNHCRKYFDQEKYSPHKMNIKLSSRPPVEEPFKCFSLPSTSKSEAAFKKSEAADQETTDFMKFEDPLTWASTMLEKQVEEYQPETAIVDLFARYRKKPTQNLLPQTPQSSNGSMKMIPLLHSPIEQFKTNKKDQQPPLSMSFASTSVASVMSHAKKVDYKDIYKTVKNMAVDRQVELFSHFYSLDALHQKAMMALLDDIKQNDVILGNSIWALVANSRTKCSLKTESN